MFTISCNKKNLIVSFLIILFPQTLQAATNNSLDSMDKGFNEITLNDHSNECISGLEDYRVANKTLSESEIECITSQLLNFQAPNVSAHQRYLAYKAEAWLDYAYRNDGISNPITIRSQAQYSAMTILQALRSDDKKQIERHLQVPSYSIIMRPDLWAVLSALKNAGGIENAAHDLAYSEVALIGATNDYCLYNHIDRDHGIGFRNAERWLEQARENYVETHDSQTNVALENQTVGYFKQFEKSQVSNDHCNSLNLPFNQQILTIENTTRLVRK